MSDLFLGQTMTYAAKFQYDNAGAFTFTLPWEADKIAVYNYTSWADTSATPLSIWFRGMPANDAMQINVIVDSGGTGEKDLVLDTADGFVEANVEGGAPAYRANISAISMANPVEITTSANHGYSTGWIVRITDLGDEMPTPRGASNLNNKRYKIVVTGADTFTLEDPVSGLPVNGIGFEAYVSGGRVVLETRVVGDPSPYEYNPIIYKVTFGAAIFHGASDDDIFYFEAIRYGSRIVDLGDLANLR